MSCLWGVERKVDICFLLELPRTFLLFLEPKRELNTILQTNTTKSYLPWTSCEVLRLKFNRVVRKTTKDRLWDYKGKQRKESEGKSKGTGGKSLRWVIKLISMHNLNPIVLDPFMHEEVL